MKSGAAWLKNLWRGRAAEVAMAYRRRLDPADPEARLVLADLARYCNVGNTSFVAGDAHQTAFNEGGRDVFLHVAAVLELDQRDVMELMETRAA